MKRALPFIFPIAAAALGYSVGILETARPENPRDAKVLAGSLSTIQAVDPKESADAEVSAVLTALTERSNFREIARLGALLENLDSDQMRALLDRIDRWPTADRERQLPRMLAYWTKRDAAAATEWMQPRLAKYAREEIFGDYSSNFDTELVGAWAKNAPELAVEYARKHVGTALARTVRQNAVSAWPDKSYARRLEVVRSFPEDKDRNQSVVSLFLTWAQIDRASALATAAGLPSGPEREGGLGAVLVHWAGAKPAEAFAKVEELGIRDPFVLTLIAKEAAESDPAVAASWLEKQSPALLPEIGSIITKFWAERDPAAAFAWAQEHGVSLLKTPDLPQNYNANMFAGHLAEIRGQSPMTFALQRKPEATLAWIRALPAGSDRDLLTEMAVPIRRRTFDDVLWLVFRGPVELGNGATMGGASEAAQNATRAWVETANVPTEWKQSWRNKLAPK